MGGLSVIAAPAWATSPQTFVSAAFRMKDQAAAAGDQAYGAVVVRESEIVGWGPEPRAAERRMGRACRARGHARRASEARPPGLERLRDVFDVASVLRMRTRRRAGAAVAHVL